MSLTINNNVTQQHTLQPQVAAAQTTNAAQSPTDASGGTAGTSATAEPSAALISGNASLTSDLLSVLLQEQSGMTTSSFGSSGSSGSSTSGGPGFTLAGMLDAQDQTTQLQSGNGFDALTSALLFPSTPQGSSTPASTSTSPTTLDPTSAVQSATSTGSVLGGIQDLLDQLAV